MFPTLRLFLKACRRLTRRLSLTLVLILGLSASPATAQITPNGLGTQVDRNGNTFNINGGTQAGRNLFHSFSQFGLNQGQVANFFSNPAIANILARVNGGSASYINGLIQVLGGSSNLFLMNPSGIVFGPNASLNVPAAFTATTADRILFPGGSFNAHGNPDVSKLVGDPIGFAFDRKDPAAIVNEANLTATSVSLVAGQVINTGKVNANNITIAAVPGENLVRLSQAGQILSLEFNPQQAASLADAAGNIPITRLPELLTGGGVTTVTANPNQTVTLAGVTVPVGTGSAIVSGVLDASSTSATGGKVGVFGTNISLVNAEINASGWTGGGEILVGGEFQGKGTQPNALNTWVNAGTILQVDAVKTGDGGRIIVWADGTTRFDGMISAKGGELSGNGGFVEISGKETLNLAPGWSRRVDVSAPNGRAGTLLLDPNNITISGTAATSTITNPEDATDSSNQLLDDDVAAFLGSNNLTIQTTGSGGDGDITITGDVNITWGTSKTLTLNADRKIVMNPGAIIKNTSATTGFDAIVFNANTAGTATGNFIGINLNTSELTSNGGNIVLTGKGGTTGANNFGIIQASGAQVTTTNGTITYSGTGGNGTSLNHGIFLAGTNTTISTTGTGSINLTGTGNGTGTDNYGIFQQSGAQVTTTNGTITYTGTGGNGTSLNHGIFLAGTNTTISTTGTGSINLTGTGNGTGTDNYGIFQQSGAQVTTTNGTITYSGTGGNGTSLNHGIFLGGTNTTISTTGTGSINLTGTGNGTGTDNYGILQQSGAQVTTTNGTITYTGTGAGTADGIRTTSGTNKIGDGTKGDITLTADRMTLDSVSIAGQSNLLIQPLTTTTTIGIGTGATGTLNLNNTQLSNIKDGFSLITIGRTDSSGAINVNGGFTFQDNLRLQNPNGGGVTIDSTLSVGTNNLTINSGGAVTQTAGSGITAKGLELLGSGAFTLTDTANNVSILAGNTTNNIKYTDANSFTIGTVNTVGVNVGGNNLTLKALTGTVDQSQKITAGGLELLGGGSFELTDTTNNISTLAANTSNDIKYTDANSFTIGTVNTVGVNVGGNNLTLKALTGTVDQSQKITAGGLELLGGGSFELTDTTNNISTLAANTSNDIKYTDANSFTIGTVNTVGVNVGGNNLTLKALTGTVDQSQKITASGLELLGGGSFELTDTTNNISTLAANTSNDIKYTDANSFTIGTVNTTDGVNVTASKNLTLKALTGTVDQSQKITAGGLELLGGGSFELTDTTNNISTLAANTSNDIKYTDANSFTIGTVNTVGVNVGGNNLTLKALTGTVDQSQKITAGGLELLGGGSFELTDTTNNISTLAANTSNDIKYTDANSFTIGTVNTTDGVNVGGNNLTLKALTGTVDQSQKITAGGLELLGGGSFELTDTTNNISTLAANTSNDIKYTDANSFTIGTVNTVGVNVGGNNLTLKALTGTVDQSQKITAGGLELLGGGSFELTDTTNNISTLAANTSNDIKYTDANSFTIGTVNTTDGVNVGGNNLTLKALTGTVDQSQKITAGGLELLGGGSFELTDTTNNISTLAANTSNDIKYTDANSFTIGTVNTVGVNVGGNNLTLKALTGTVDQSQKITAGGLELLGGGSFELTDTTNNISTLAANTSNDIKYTDANSFTIGTVNTTDGVNVTASKNLTLKALTGTVDQSQKITASGLELLGGGSFELTDTTNNISTLAANTSNDIKYTDANSFTIGTVNTTDGVNVTASKNLTLKALTGTVDQSQKITASGLELLGGGSFELTDTTNNISTLAANTSNDIKYTDANSFTIGTVNTTDGVNVTASKNLTLKALTGTVDQSQKITASGLELLGGGSFELTDTTNNISTLAANTSNDIKYTDANSFTIGTVNTTDGVNVTASKNLTLKALTGTVDQSQKITASGLELLGGGSFELTDTTNNISTLAANTSNDIKYTDANSFTIGTVNTTDGVNVTASKNLTLKALTGTVDQSQKITASGLELLGGGSFELTDTTNNISTLAANTSNDIKYTDANSFTIGTVNTTDGVNVTASKNLTLKALTGTVDQSQKITASGLELLGGGSFELTDTTNNISTLAANTSNDIKYTDANSFTIGTVNTTDGVNVTASKNLTLKALTGTVDQSQKITASGLELLGGGSFELTDTTNNISTLAANTSNDIKYTDANSFTIGTVNTTDGVNVTASKNLTLKALTGTVDQSQKITASGLELLGGGSFELTDTTNNISTLAANTSNDIKYTDANSFTIGTVNTTDGVNVTASKNLTLKALTGTVDQSQKITASGLELLGGGSFELTDTTNNISTLAANTSNDIKYTDANSFTIGTVNTTDGVNVTASKNLTLKALTGTVDQSQKITASGLELLGGGSFELTDTTNNISTLAANTSNDIKYTDANSFTIGTVNTTDGVNVTASKNLTLKALTGTVDQSQKITASGLELLGGGSFELTDTTNNISTLAANTSNDIKYTDANSFTIGTVNTTDGVNVTASKNLTLKALTGTVDQSQKITASGLELLGGGSFELTDTTNNISTLAANTSNDIKYTDANSFTIGTVNTTDGVNVTASKNLTLKALTGTVDQSQKITASGLELLGGGSFELTDTTNNISTLAANTSNDIKYTDANSFTIGTVNTTDGVNVTASKNLTLKALTGTVDQSQKITASGLELLGGGSFELTDTTNNISTLAANTSNDIKYTDANSFTIGTVNTVGITTSNNNVTLKSNSTTDAITFAQNVNIGTGNLTVESGTINQTGGTITVNGTASFTATKANTGNVIAKNVNAGGTQLGDSEIGGDFTLTSTGNVTQAGGTTLKVAGKTTINAPGATLTNPGNVLPYFVDTAGNTTIENVGTIDLPAQTVTGNLSATALASGNAYNSVFSGSAINLNEANTFGGKVSFNTKTDTFGAKSGTPTIIQSGAQTVTGTSTFNAVGAGGTITLDASNQFTGAVTLNTGLAGGNISFKNTVVDTEITSATTGATLTLENAGTTTQTGAIQADTLIVQGSGNYTLDNATNNVNTLTVSTTGSTIYIDSDALSFNTTGTVGSLKITADGDLTQTSNVDSSAKVELLSNTGNISAVGKNIDAIAEILITSTKGTIEVGDLSSQATTGDRMIDLFAPVGIKAGDVTTKGGGVEIITSGGTYSTDGFGRISNLVFANKDAGPVKVGDVTTKGGQIILASPDPNIPLKTGILDSSGGDGNILILARAVGIDYIVGGTQPVNILALDGVKITGQDASGFSIKTNGGLIDIQYALTGTFTVGTTTVTGTKGKITSNGLITLSPTQTFQCFPSNCGVFDNISIRVTDPVFASAFNPPTPTQNPPLPTLPELQANPFAGLTGREVDTDQLLDVSEVLKTQLDVATEEGIFSIDVAFGAEFANYLGVKAANTLRTTADVRSLLEAIYKQTGRKTAIVYWVLDQLNLNIVLLTPGIPQGIAQNQGTVVASVDLATGIVQQPRNAPLTYRGVPEARRDEVMRVVARFRNRLGDIRLRGDQEYLKDAQALYRWMISPIEAELQAQGIDTLLVVPDQGIRLLPLAALHDGKQFLIEKYNVGMTPSINLISTRYRPMQGADVLAMGASTFANESPLPSVPTELKTITSIWPGRYFLNQDFTPERLVQERKAGQQRIVHLATHATFKPGDLSNSYIVFGNNENFPVTRLPQLSLQGVELLTLGACRTLIGATTDQTVEFGFAGLAVKTGVESVVASLWNVDDTSTLALMTEFYRYLQKTPIKSEALRQAQLALMKGQTKVEGGQLRLVTRSGQTIPLPPELAQVKDLDFSHPYFWAGFSMIGSPW